MEREQSLGLKIVLLFGSDRTTYSSLCVRVGGIVGLTIGRYTHCDKI